MNKDPEERRNETHRHREEREAANEGREGDRRRSQQVPPALEPTREPGIREGPYPREQERPPHSLERPWWHRIFRGPHEEDTERPQEEPSEALGGPGSGTARLKRDLTASPCRALSSHLLRLIECRFGTNPDFADSLRSRGFSEVGLLGGPQAVLYLDAIPKLQYRLSYASTLCWAMVAEKYASSGRLCV